MKLKLLKKNATSTDALLVHVEYGGDEDNIGRALPKKKYIEKVNIGQTITVDDEIGHAILGKYSKLFSVDHERSTKEVSQAPNVKV